MRILQGLLAGTVAELLIFGFFVVASFLVLAVILGNPRLYSKRLDRYFFAIGALVGIAIAWGFGGVPAAALQVVISIAAWRYVRKATKALDSF